MYVDAYSIKVIPEDAEDFEEILKDNNIIFEEPYFLDSIYGGDGMVTFLFKDEKNYNNALDIKRKFIKESLNEGAIKTLMYDLIDAVKVSYDRGNETIPEIDADIKVVLSPEELKFYEEYKDLIVKMAFEEDIEEIDIDEASGLKDDVLRPWGGRKARKDMGYGKGGRCNYHPEDEIEDEDIYIEPID